MDSSSFSDSGALGVIAEFELVDARSDHYLGHNVFSLQLRFQIDGASSASLNLIERAEGSSRSRTSALESCASIGLSSVAFSSVCFFSCTFALW